MPSGGPRQPARPAAVSNPQSGARTDGGAGSKSQPLRIPSGGPTGARQAAVEQQQGAPLPVGGPPSVGQGGGGGGSVPQPGTGAFGPTQRPNEPAIAGASPAGDLMNQGFDTTRAVLQMIYDRYPSPYIAALMNNE